MILFILISFFVMIHESPSMIILFCNTACTRFTWHNSRKRAPKMRRSGRLQEVVSYERETAEGPLRGEIRTRLLFAEIVLHVMFRLQCM